MNKKLIIFLPIFLVLVATTLLHSTHAAQYNVINNVPNTPGGQLFDKEIGVRFASSTMIIVRKFILKTFEQTDISDIKPVRVLNVYISDFKGYAYKNGDNINVSGPGLNKFYFPRYRSKFYFISLLYHEMTHVYQWSGVFTAPGGLTEGIADYGMLKSTYFEKEKYTKPGWGNSWDQGYGVTARFLEYCDTLNRGFTAKLNKKMRYSYSDRYFVELLNKTVDHLWKDYMKKYSGKI